LIGRMYSLQWSRLRSSSKLSPKQNINIVCVQYETLAKHQNIEILNCYQFKKPISSSQTTLHDVPMGSKKTAFMSRTLQEKHLRKKLPLSNPHLSHPEIYNFEKVLKPVEKIQDNCSGKDMNSSRKPGANLEMVAYQLTHDLTNIFMQRQDWSIYHKELVLQDNIRGVRLVGLEKYMLLINMLRLLAHIRFVYVRMSLLSLTKEEEEGVIKVRWRVVGLGFGRMLLRYFPDRLWEKGNMERMSPCYLDGYSTFYLDSNSKIYQHTVDRVMEDKEKEVQKTMVQRLLELKQKAETQAAI